MTAFAASETFPETPGMSLCGRFSPLPVLLVANTQGPSKVLYALVTGRLAAAYIINDLTTGDEVFGPLAWGGLI
jgi:hypothetical protein